MKILIGCPIKDRGWCLPSWYEGIEDQGLEVEVITILSPSADNTELLLKERNIEILYDDDPGRPPQEIDGHVWHAVQYAYMARLRNQLLDWATAAEADYFLSLDSDIVLSANALSALIAFNQSHPGVVAPAVNMSSGNSVAWNTMNWTNPNAPRLATRGSPPTSGKVDVIMAAMLFDRRSIAQCRWQDNNQGEDVGFCLDAEARGINRYWLSEIRCAHRVRKMT
jgi:hypothetical protein